MDFRGQKPCKASISSACGSVKTGLASGTTVREVPSRTVCLRQAYNLNDLIPYLVNFAFWVRRSSFWRSDQAKFSNPAKVNQDHLSKLAFAQARATVGHGPAKFSSVMEIMKHRNVNA